MPTFEEIRELREEWEATLDRAAYRDRVAEQIAAMSPGDPGRAELLACASSELSIHDASESDLVLAEELARAAIEDGGPSTLDPRIDLLRALFKLGREEEAVAAFRETLRDRTTTAVTVGLHAPLGEMLEELGRPELAVRAYTVGLRDFDPELVSPDMDESLCLTGRYRARRRLGKPYDVLDRYLDDIAPDTAERLRGDHTSGRDA